MICPTSEDIVELLYHGSDQAGIDAFFEHAQNCEACRARLESISPPKLSGRGSLVTFSRMMQPPFEGGYAIVTAVEKFFRHQPWFHCVGELGAGAMGRVFECFDTRQNRLVAIKLINRDKATPGMISRISREARIQARFDHPHIVRLLESGFDHGFPYLVMEHVAGCNLREFLRDGQFSPKQAAFCLRQIAAGVAAAHAEGVLHRDLKPANILLEGCGGRNPPRSPNRMAVSDFVLKVTDFGLARMFEDENDQSSSMVVVGTPAYMSPEQVPGSMEKLSPASDIHALGVILYEMLTGLVPFFGDDNSEIFEAILNRVPMSPRELRSGIPRHLETICLKCLEKQPRSRYATAEALVADLDRFLADLPIQARPVGLRQKTWRWIWANPLPAFSVLALVASIVSLLAGESYYASNQNQLRVQAVQDRETARHNEAVATARAAMLRDKYFEELNIVRQLYHDVHNHKESGYNKQDMDSLYFKITEIRFKKAIQMISLPEMLAQRSELLVESFYLVGLKLQTTDQEMARPYFEEAVRRAAEIKSIGPMTDYGRFCAINSLNYLGVFRHQRHDFHGSLGLFKRGWDDYRALPGESPVNARLKKFSLIIGRNYLEMLEELHLNQQADSIRQEIIRIEALPVVHPNDI